MAALLVLITFLALKVLGEWRERSFNEDEGEINPLMHRSDYHKTVTINYGAFEKDLESQTNCNGDGSDDCTSSKCTTLYDAKICIVCYDQPRNCFFVPCGHCATCFSCAQRYVIFIHQFWECWLLMLFFFIHLNFRVHNPNSGLILKLDEIKISVWKFFRSDQAV